MALLRRATHWFGEARHDRAVQYAAMADRLMMLHAWMHGHTSVLNAVGPAAQRWERTADMILLHILGADFYMRDATGVQLGIWLADPTLAAAAQKHNTPRAATAFIAVLRRAPLSPLAFYSLVHEGCHLPPA
jgi:hypothetical protein